MYEPLKGGYFALGITIGLITGLILGVSSQNSSFQFLSDPALVGGLVGALLASVATIVAAIMNSASLAEERRLRVKGRRADEAQKLFVLASQHRDLFMKASQYYYGDEPRNMTTIQEVRGGRLLRSTTFRKPLYVPNDPSNILSANADFAFSSRDADLFNIILECRSAHASLQFLLGRHVSLFEQLEAHARSRNKVKLRGTSISAQTTPDQLMLLMIQEIEQHIRRLCGDHAVTAQKLVYKVINILETEFGQKVDYQERQDISPVAESGLAAVLARREGR